MATEALTEAEKLAQVPGIVYVDGPAGRRAKVAGDLITLAENYPWMTREQIRAGLRFYQLFPEEIDRWLACEREIADRLEAAPRITAELLRELADR